MSIQKTVRYELTAEVFTKTNACHMAKKTFESALKRLEQITTELEDGDPNLEKSLKKFDEGIELVKFCNTKLEEARQRVDLLVNRNGSLTAVDFYEEEQEDGDQDVS